MMTPSTESIWRAMSEELRRFFARRVEDEHVADDLTQDTFARIHGSLDTLADAARVRAWVFQIARSVLADHFRRSARSLNHLEGEVEAEPEPPRPGARWVDELVERLPETYRVPLLLAEVDGLSQREIAARLGLSISCAKSRVQRGRALLRKELDACCRFEFDRRGAVIDAVPRPERSVCRDC